MDARARLDRLKYTWLAYGVFAAIVDIFRYGLDGDSLFAAGIRIASAYAIAWFLTRQLLNKSSLMWAIGVVYSMLGVFGSLLTVIEVIRDARDGYDFEVATFLIACAAGFVYVQTFRTLRHRDVKRHVMIDD